LAENIKAILKDLAAGESVRFSSLVLPSAMSKQIHEMPTIDHVLQAMDDELQPIADAVATAEMAAGGLGAMGGALLGVKAGLTSPLLREIFPSAMYTLLGLDVRRNVADIEQLLREELAMAQFPTMPEFPTYPPSVPSEPLLPVEPLEPHKPAPHSSAATNPEVQYSPLYPEIVPMTPSAPPLEEKRFAPEPPAKPQVREPIIMPPQPNYGPAIAAAITQGLRMLGNEDTIVNAGGGGSARPKMQPEAPPHCAVIVKSALESGDDAAVPMECRELYNWAIANPGKLEVSHDTSASVSTSRRATFGPAKPGRFTRTYGKGIRPRRTNPSLGRT
jgi:hypothetical protein